MRILIIYLLFLTACTTTNPIKEDVNKKTELPKLQADTIILSHEYFTISYNKFHRLANWVRYSLNKKDLSGPGDRKKYKRFFPDPLLVEKSIPPVIHDDYTHSGYARGHLAPAEDFSRSQEASKSTFIMSNVIPQKGSINSGSWAQLEKKVREWACGEETITVITGPILTDKLTKLVNEISIPQEFFKIIIDETPPKKAISFIYNQNAPKQSVDKNQKPLPEVLLKSQLNLEVVEDSIPQDWKACK
jgi:endonuclease G